AAAHEDVERAHRRGRRPFCARFTFEVREPLHLNVGGPQRIAFAWHEVTDEPAAGVLIGIARVSKNWDHAPRVSSQNASRPSLWSAASSPHHLAEQVRARTPALHKNASRPISRVLYPFG